MSLEIGELQAFCQSSLGVPLTREPLISIGAVRWRPILGSASENVAVYQCGSDDIGLSIRRRIAATIAGGVRVAVVLPEHPASLRDESLAFLLNSDAEIVVTTDGVLTLFPDFAVTTWELGLFLPSEIAAAAVSDRLRLALTVSVSEKGKKLEQALALASSQVPAWKVRGTNLQTSNEELDIVVANNSARSPWNGTAYVLIEAKNWTSSVDRVEYDAFHMKVKERGGSCRLGLFVAAHGFSSGFYERASHHGSEGFSIVPISLDRIVARLDGGMSIEDLLIERVEQVVLDRQWEVD